MFEKWCNLKRPGRGDPCLRVPPDIVRYPDPSISFIENGSPRFDSADVSYVFDGLDIPSRVSVRTRNLSPGAAAEGVRIDLSWSRFGVGQERLSIGSAVVSLGRSGAVGSEQIAYFSLPPENTLPGGWWMVGTRDEGGSTLIFGNPLFVRLQHPYDRDTVNNRCDWQMMDWGFTPGAVPSALPFPLRNSLPTRATFTMDVAPTTFAANATPSSVALDPGETVNVFFSALPPVSALPFRFHVSITTAGALYGGVTWYMYSL